MAFYPTFIASYMKETWLALDTQPGFSTLWGLPQNLHSATDPFLLLGCTQIIAENGFINAPVRVGERSLNDVVCIVIGQWYHVGHF